MNSRPRIRCALCSLAPRMQPKPERKSSPVLTVILALILIGVIIFGYKKIKPVFDDARQQNQIQRTAPVEKNPSQGQAADTNNSSASDGTNSASDSGADKNNRSEERR